jgi:hypothetical protein
MYTVGKANAEVNLEDAKENTRIIEEYYYGKKFPLFVDGRNVKSISKEARDHFSLKGRESVINCFAMIVSSPLSRIIASFFIGINRPTVPVKMFDDEKKAVEWLKKQL